MRRSNTTLTAFLCILLFSIFAAGSPSQAMDLQSTKGERLRDLFKDANDAYEKGEYEDAIAKYESLIGSGVRAGDLFYNLGNSYYKNGELGMAILSYERALRLDPRDKDVRRNLYLVNSMIRDKQFIKKEVWIAKIAAWLYNNLAADEAIILSSSLYILFCIMLVFFILMDSFSMIASIHRRISIISPGRLLGLSAKQDMVAAIAMVFVLFAGATTLSAHKIIREGQHDIAVVVDSEVAVYSAPYTDSILQFKIHEGTRVRFRESREGWIRIDLPGGLSGWIEKGAAQLI